MQAGRAIWQDGPLNDHTGAHATDSIQTGLFFQQTDYPRYLETGTAFSSSGYMFLNNIVNLLWMHPSAQAIISF